MLEHCDRDEGNACELHAASFLYHMLSKVAFWQSDFSFHSVFSHHVWFCHPCICLMFILHYYWMYIINCLVFILLCGYEWLLHLDATSTFSDKLLSLALFFCLRHPIRREPICHHTKGKGAHVSIHCCAVFRFHPSGRRFLRSTLAHMTQMIDGGEYCAPLMLLLDFCSAQNLLRLPPSLPFLFANGKPRAIWKASFSCKCAANGCELVGCGDKSCMAANCTDAQGDNWPFDGSSRRLIGRDDWMCLIGGDLWGHHCPLHVALSL